MFQARDGTRWFGSMDRGVYRYDGRELVRFSVAHGLGAGRVAAIDEDRAGSVFVATDPGGVRRFDGSGFREVPRAPEPSWRLHPDDLWFSAGQETDAVYRWDGTLLHRLSFPRTAAGDAHYAAYPRSRFPNMRYGPYDVYTVFRDGRGHLWFGTGSLGACRYDGVAFAWADTAGLGLGANDSFGVRAIAEDREGRFWFSHAMARFAVLPAAAGERGPVALGYRRETGAAGPEDPYSHFLSATRDRDGDLLVATLGAGVWRYDGTRMTHLPVTHGGRAVRLHAVYLDREDVLWVGTQEHGAYRFDGERFVPWRP